MSRLRLGCLGSGKHFALVLQVIRNRFRGAPDRAGADLFDDRVVVLGSVDLGGGQSGGAFSRLVVIVIVERAEQAHTETIVAIIVARDRETGHGLAGLLRRSGPRLPNGFLVPQFFRHGLRFHGSLGRSGHRLRDSREFGRGRRGQRSEVQTVQIVRVIDRTTGRKVNSEKLLCQRLGRRLAAGTGGIGLVHNP